MFTGSGNDGNITGLNNPSGAFHTPTKVTWSKNAKLGVAAFGPAGCTQAFPVSGAAELIHAFRRQARGGTRKQPLEQLAPPFLLSGGPPVSGGERSSCLGKSGIYSQEEGLGFEVVD